MKILKILSISISLALLVSGSVFGATIKVPDDYATIQQAIDAAVGGDTVLVAPDTYNEGIDFLGKKITVRSEAGPDLTIIKTTFFIRFTTGETEETLLEGFKIIGGIDIFNGSSPQIKKCNLIGVGTHGSGGHGSIGSGSSPTFIDCKINAGRASIGGGYDVRGDSSATFIDCEFSNNEADSNGGAIYIDENSSVTIANCTLRDNTAGGNGGGIFNRGTLTISYSSIVENDGGFGSGIINYGTMSISNSTISDNDGNPASSGGIENAGNATLINSTIQRNFGGEGAGIGNSGDITLTNSNISDNDGSGGIGGILNFGSVTLINTTISGNKGYFAGGIDNVGYGGANVSLTNCTVSNNSASASNPNAAGGIVGGDTVKLQNTIIALNTAPHNPDCSREVISLDNNLIGDPTGCTITIQANDLMGDPGLGAFTDDGTPGRGHFPLLKGSPAIDKGNVDACPSTDQLGNPRIDGDGDGVVTCDIGAVEFQGIVLINDLVTFEPDPSTYLFTPDTTDCQTGAVGKFSFDATLTNISKKELTDLLVEVDELTSNNLLMTDNGLIGEGERFEVPKIDDYDDGILGPEEYVDVPFCVCIQNKNPFRFFVNVLGVAAD